ncbi:hypothetical protein B0H19DRAFT_1083920, partial [Mycena capillaripes]
QSKAAQKVRESNELTQYEQKVNSDLAALQKDRRQLSTQDKALREKEKSLRESLKSAKKSTRVAVGAGTSSKRTIVSASSTGRVKTTTFAVSVNLPLPQDQMAVEIEPLSERPVAPALPPYAAIEFSVPNEIPPAIFPLSVTPLPRPLEVALPAAPIFDPRQFQMQSDLAFLENSGYNFNFYFEFDPFAFDTLTPFVPEALQASGSHSEFAFMPAQEPAAPPSVLAWGYNTDWSLVEELPRLPPAPISSPPYAQLEEPMVNLFPEAEPAVARHDIDLELSEKNILRVKRARTLSARAADAVASKKPRSSVA